MASLLRTTLLLASIAHAADVGTYTYTSSPNLNTTAITSFNSTSNSTNSRKLDSIIYDSPFNLTSLHPVYTLTLAISEHSSPSPSPSEERTTSSLIYITPPPPSTLGLSSNTNATTALTSWDACAVVFKRITDSATKRGENEDGGCTPTLGKQCIDALFAQIEENTKISVSCGSLLMSIPDECKEAVGGDTTDLLGFDLNPSPSSSTPLPLLLTESASHASSNTTFYDEASHRIWPVLVYQKAGSGNADSGLNSAATKQIACMKDRDAKRSESGTTTPTPKPTESGEPSMAVGMGSLVGGWGVVLSAAVGGLAMVV